MPCGWRSKEAPRAKTPAFPIMALSFSKVNSKRPLASLRSVREPVRIRCIKEKGYFFRSPSPWPGR